MLKTFLLPALLISVIAAAGVTQANPLQISAAGMFGQSTTSNQLVSPGANWAMQFVIDSNPSANNVDTLGFDAPFTSFSYQLAGTQVNTSPGEVRFSTASNGGLFTVYFGPESGYSNGTPIPEFLFEGPQAFAGTTASPSFTSGTFALSSWTYSDSNNIDDHLAAGEQITITAAAPEPSTAWLTVLSAAGLCAIGVRRLKLGLPSNSE